MRLLLVAAAVALTVTAEPAPPMSTCTEPDGACIGWSELHYPGIEWRTD